MIDETQQHDEEIIEEQAEDQAEQEESTEGEEQAKDAEGEEQSEEQSEEKVEEEQQAAPPWVKDLRKRIRESERARKEAEAKLESLTQIAKPKELSKKPELSQFDFDTDKYEAALETWYADKHKVDAEKAAQAQAEEAQKAAWNEKLESFKAEKTALALPDYAEREEDVAAMLSTAQQSILVKYAASPTKLIHRIGGDPEKLMALSKIADPIQFAIEITKMEETPMKTAPGKTKPPAPERRPAGNSGAPVAANSTLERLRAEAEKTGDYTKINAYKRQQREKSK